MDPNTDYTPAIAGLRTFTKVAFTVLLVVGALAIFGGAVTMAVPYGSDAGLTGLLSGALCILGAFGVRYLLDVLADMASDVRAQRILLARMQLDPQAPVSAPTAAAASAAGTAAVSSSQIRNAAAQARAAAAARRPASASAPGPSARPPMPTGGTMSHPPMPSLGSDKPTEDS